MITGLSAPWAAGAGDRRLPTSSELGAGIPCGPFDRKLINELYYRLSLLNRELANLVTDAGIAIDVNDEHQAFKAALRMHRIVENVTFHVPSQYATIHEALEATSALTIPNDVLVKIQLAAGDHVVNVATGPILFAHPYGSRIVIEGAALTGAFPNASTSEAGNASSSTVEATLRSRFPTRIVCQGQHGLFVEHSSIGGLRNLLFIGDATATDWCGVIAGEWRDRESGGGIWAQDCWAHGFGGDGWRVHSGRLTGRRFGASHNLKHGFRGTNVSKIEAIERWISTRNAFNGIHAQDIGLLDGSTSANDFSYNGFRGIGVELNSAGRFDRIGSNVTNLDGNGVEAALALYNSAILFQVPGVTGAGTLFKADMDSSIQFLTLPTGSPTYSPALNTSGNANSYIRG